MSYGKQRWKQIIPCFAVLTACNLYFFYFIQNGHPGYLLYLDTLIIVPGLIITAVDYYRFQKRKAEKKRLMDQDALICRTISGFENQDIAEHDVRVLEEQERLQFQENCDLQDYVAAWCHELKLPLSAAFLMDEKVTDKELKLALREQLEKMNQQIGTMLLGCRLQSPLFDLQVRKTGLPECVKTSVHNNQFFLIQKGFQLTLKVEPLAVYTDPAWLVYILDQLLHNALKYGRKPEKCGQAKTAANPEHPVSSPGPDSQKREAPRLSIWTHKEEEIVRLFVEDQGEGILADDIQRIFEKGYTGGNYHNGKYKSTGMGLYMVSKIIRRLGHEIQVESEYGVYTRFCIIFQENPYFLR